MNQRSFFTQLTVLSVFVGLLLLALNTIPAIHPYQGLSWLSSSFFILLSIIMYLAGQKAAQSQNKNNFSRVVFGFIGVKMMLSVVLVFIYSETVRPTSGHFLVPFFVTYLVYTIFETHFMMKIGQVKTPADT